MRIQPLGRSGLIVSELSLGTMIFGEEGPRGTPAEDATRMLHRYLDAGGNLIDTADVYAGGRSEEIVGRAIAERRDDVVLASKVRFRTGAGPNDEGLGRRHILQGVHESLKRLGTDRLDILYVHAWDPVTPLEETLRALDDLVRDGAVRYLGVSNFKAWQLAKALELQDRHGWARFVVGQYQYSLVTRDIEYEFTDLALREGVDISPWGPLGGGFLSGKYRKGQRPEEGEGRIAYAPDEHAEAWSRRSNERNWNIVDAVGAIAEAHGATYPQVAIAWLLAKPWVTSPILGARTLEQLEDNLGAAEVRLTEDEVETLDEASALPDLYPYRMIATNAARSFDD